MANVEHSALTGSDLHEPKGVSTAGNNTVYVANGAGSGSWTAQKFVMNGTLSDITSTSTSIYMAIPYDCVVKEFLVSVQGSAYSGTPVARLRNNGGTVVTGGDVSMPSSGVSTGDVFSATCTANNTFSAGDKIRVLIGTGGGGTACSGEFTIAAELL